MKLKKKFEIIIYTAGITVLMASCGNPSATWNPSTVSLTPAPTVVGQADITVTPILSGSDVQNPPTDNTPTVPVTVTPEATITPEATATPKPVLTVDDFDAADFFNGSVFAGDSVLSHFYWKVPFNEKELFGGSNFLVAVSYSAREALKPISETSVHPPYKGEQQLIWDSMAMMEAKRVVLFFGLNDIGVDGVDGFCENYQKLISNVQEAVPNAKIYLISTTPMRADSETKNLTNANITAANEKMQQYCEENGFGFIDIATSLMDENGALQEQYSDGTNVHQTKAAYLVWKDILVQYAKEQLLLEYNTATE